MFCQMAYALSILLRCCCYPPYPSGTTLSEGLWGDFQSRRQKVIYTTRDNFFPISMRRGMHPNGQDIFGEVDWMEGHRMEERPRNLVIRALGRHDITLHIDARYAPADQRLACILGNKFPADDGCMEGGASVAFVGSITKDEFLNNYYGNNVYFRPDRHNIFRYALFAHELESPAFGRSVPQKNPTTKRDYAHYGDRFMIGDESIQNYLGWNSWFTSDYTEGQAYVFMHELGHALGLAHPTDNNVSTGNLGKTIITCMYSGMFSFIDYAINNPNGRAADPSDPYNEIDVTNEWNAINLTWGLVF